MECNKQLSRSYRKKRLNLGNRAHVPTFIDNHGRKQEGDLKSPVGVFRLGKWMGYAPRLPVDNDFEYEQITDTTEGIDDPASVYYNQIIDAATVKGDWHSFEKMKRIDGLYKWLIVIEYNPENQPGAGSMIFLHIWRNQNSGTAGCTAIAEQNMIELFKWLDKKKDPVMVQLPLPVYEVYQISGELPTVR